MVGDEGDAEVAVGRQQRIGRQTRQQVERQAALALAVFALRRAERGTADQAGVEVVAHDDVQDGPVARTVRVAGGGKRFAQVLRGGQGKGAAVEEHDTAVLPRGLAADVEGVEDAAGQPAGQFRVEALAPPAVAGSLAETMPSSRRLQWGRSALGKVNSRALTASSREAPPWRRW